MTTNLPSATSSNNSKKFKPTDQELIQVFLYNKINGIPLPSAASNSIVEFDLYGKKNPWEIWKEFGGSNSSHDGKDFYFFTKLKRKSVNSTRSDRTIGSGSWEGEDVGKPVVVKGTDQRIGLKKRFRFEKSQTNEDGGWIMHEYSIDSSMIPNHPENNYVLCRFRKNIRRNVTASEQETSTGETSRQEVNQVTRGRKAVVLAIEAITRSVNNDVEMGKDTLEGSKDRSENENKSVAVAKTTNRIKSNNKEQLKDNDLSDMSWPELFSLQLRILNKDLIQDKDIPMLPDTLYKELLSLMKED